MVVVLKLGGSVITDKETPETVDRAALVDGARAIAEATEPLVLVHGGGSFGHYHAQRHGVSVTEGTRDPHAVADIHASMRELNARVVAALHDLDVAAVGIEPLSLAHRDGAGTLAVPLGGLETVVDGGFVPVLFGDVVPHDGRGFTVVSGDELAVTVAARLGATRVGMCAGVPGVLDADGNVLERIGSMADVETLGTGDGWDVTGGMAGKVRALLGLSIPAAVFGLDALPGFLAGEAVGTQIDGAGPPPAESDADE